MKQVTVGFKEYALKKKVRSDGDGDVYLVEGGESQQLCVKLLKDRSDRKKSEVEASLKGSYFGPVTDKPMDIAFSRGRFAGYLYQDRYAWESQQGQPGSPFSGSSPFGGWQDPAQRGNMPMPGGGLMPGGGAGQGGGSTPGSKGASSLGGLFVPTGEIQSSKNTPSENPAVKWGGLCLGVIVLSALNMKVFHFMFLDFIAGSFSQDVLDGCMMLSLSGLTGIVVGLIITGFLCVKLSREGTSVFLSGGLGGFLAGLLLADVVIALIVQVVLGVVNILLSLMPVIIIIGALIYIFRSLLGSGKK